MKQEWERIAKEVAKVNRLVLNEEVLKQSEFPFPVDIAVPIPALQVPQTNGLWYMFGHEEGEVCFYMG